MQVFEPRIRVFIKESFLRFTKVLNHSGNVDIGLYDTFYHLTALVEKHYLKNTEKNYTFKWNKTPWMTLRPFAKEGTEKQNDAGEHTCWGQNTAEGAEWAVTGLKVRCCIKK